VISVPPLSKDLVMQKKYIPPRTCLSCFLERDLMIQISGETSPQEADAKSYYRQFTSLVPEEDRHSVWD